MPDTYYNPNNPTLSQAAQNMLANLTGPTQAQIDEYSSPVTPYDPAYTHAPYAEPVLTNWQPDASPPYAPPLNITNPITPYDPYNPTLTEAAQNMLGGLVGPTQAEIDYYSGPIEPYDPPYTHAPFAPPVYQGDTPFLPARGEIGFPGSGPASEVPVPYTGQGPFLPYNGEIGFPGSGPASYPPYDPFPQTSDPGTHTTGEDSPVGSNPDPVPSGDQPLGEISTLLDAFNQMFLPASAAAVSPAQAPGVTVVPGASDSGGGGNQQLVIWLAVLGIAVTIGLHWWHHKPKG